MSHQCGSSYSPNCYSEARVFAILLFLISKGITINNMCRNMMG